MYFVSRAHLGERLAERFGDKKGTDAIVVNLNESGLMAAIELARQLHGWVYPLLTERITVPGDPRVLGVINQEGAFTYNPDLSIFEREEIEMDFSGALADIKRSAFSSLNKRTTGYGQISPEAFRGRTVILCGDVVRDRLEIAAAMELLKRFNTQVVVGALGNVASQTSGEITLATDEVEFMDVLSYMFDDDHYFEQPDPYTAEQQQQIAMNIAQYWA